MKHSAVVAMTAGVAIVGGALLLKGLAGDGPSDPTASVRNGAPQGLLALHRWLDARGVELRIQNRFGQPLPSSGAVLVVPPPEGAMWTTLEVEHVLDAVRRAELDVVLICDEGKGRRRRLGTWQRQLGVSCTDGGREKVFAAGTLPAYRGRAFVRTIGRVAADDEAVAIPAWADEDNAAVVMQLRLGGQAGGLGRVTVVGSASVFQNDGLAEADNAAVVLSLLGSGRTVAIDEAHHHARRREVLARAFRGPGPRAGLIALLLLLPLALLGMVPRPGDAPAGPRERPYAAAEAAARALAALYVEADVLERDVSPSETTRTAAQTSGNVRT